MTDRPSRLAPRGATAPATADDVDGFLDAVRDAPPPGAAGHRGRLIFALDATASRQPTWDRAASLQADMFGSVAAIGGLDVQLAYYRGHAECRASSWTASAARLVGWMERIDCRAGRTQIARLLEHGNAEARKAPVGALVFVGDMVEEDVDRLGLLNAVAAWAAGGREALARLGSSSSGARALLRQLSP